MRLYCPTPIDQSLNSVALPIQTSIESSSSLLVTSFWDNRSSATKGVVVAELHCCCKLYHLLDTGSDASVYPEESRLTFPPLTNSENTTVSCRSPDVSTKCIGLPKPSAFICTLVLKPPALRPKAWVSGSPFLPQQRAGALELQCYQQNLLPNRCFLPNLLAASGFPISFATALRFAIGKSD